MAITLKNIFKILLGAYLLLLHSHLFAQNTLTICGEGAYTLPAKKWSYLPSADAQPVQIWQQYQAGKFTTINSEVFNGGIASEVCWFHFSVGDTSLAGHDMLVEIASPRLNRIELFQRRNDSLVSLGVLGDFFPFAQRPYKHKNFVYPVRLGGRSSTDFLLKVDQVGHTLILPIRLYTASGFQESTSRDYFFGGLTYGILLFVSLFSFLFFLNTRQTLYMWYSLYIFSSILWFFSFFGLGYALIWGFSPWANVVGAPFMADINLILNLQICQILLKLGQADPRLNRVMNIAKIALAITAITPVFLNLNSASYQVNHTYLSIFLIVILLSMGVMSYSILLYAFKGSSAARYYGLAGLMKVGSIINLALLELGWSPALNNLEVLLQMGILFEILLLSYAMAKRYNLFKFQTFQHVLEAREKERSLIGKTIHDEISNPLTGLTYSLLNKANALNSDPEHRAVIDLVREQVKAVQEHARSISHTMVPDYIQRNSLTELVERYINGIRGGMTSNGDKQPISFHFSTNEQPVRLDIFQKSSLYRVIVELINNVVKHSGATSVDIILVTKRKELTLIVDDNGKGFDPQARRSGIGLDTVRSTIELLNGRMNLESYEKGQSQKLTGSRITIKIPYNQKNSRNSKAYDF